MEPSSGSNGDPLPDSGEMTAVTDPPAPEALPASRSLGLKLVDSVFKSSPGSESDVFSPDNFRHGEGGWWLDRLLPGSAGKYFAFAAAVCTGVWLIALVLRLWHFDFENIPGEIWRFVIDRQWQLQPLLLFIHFVCMRLFRAIYSGTFLKAFVHLDVKDEDLEKKRVWFFGKRVNLFAPLIAAPFIVWDVVLFTDVVAFNEALYGEDSAFLARIEMTSHMPEAWFMLGIWVVEWLIYGYYCYLMIAGALVLRKLLKNHEFVDAVDLVLTERQYRPLFNVTAQAGSLVFVYGLLHLGYVLYSKSAWSDVAGLIFLVVVLGVAFVITWTSVRGVLKDSVDEVVEALEKSYRETRGKLVEIADHPGIHGDLLRVQVQLKIQLALQQLDYIQSKYDNLGRREFLGLMFRMLAPVGTVLARVIRWGSLLALFGLGGAAAFGGADRARQAMGEKKEAETQQEAPADPANPGKQDAAPTE